MLEASKRNRGTVIAFVLFAAGVTGTVLDANGPNRNRSIRCRGGCSGVSQPRPVPWRGSATRGDTSQVDASSQRGSRGARSYCGSGHGCGGRALCGLARCRHESSARVCDLVGILRARCVACRCRCAHRASVAPNDRLGHARARRVPCEWAGDPTVNHLDPMPPTVRPAAPSSPLHSLTSTCV